MQTELETVRLQNGRGRPRIELAPTEHPVALEQRAGISFDQSLERYALNSHDIQAALRE